MKSENIKVRVDTVTKQDLERIAFDNHVSVGHVIRDAIRYKINSELPSCPHCQSRDISKPRGTFDAGLCRTIVERHCEDCGQIFEVRE